MSTCFSPDIPIRREDTEMRADLASLSTRSELALWFDCREEKKNQYLICNNLAKFKIHSS